MDTPKIKLLNLFNNSVVSTLKCKYKYNVQTKIQFHCEKESTDSPLSGSGD
jgi:hypothetical protein